MSHKAKNITEVLQDTGLTMEELATLISEHGGRIPGILLITAEECDDCEKEYFAAPGGKHPQRLCPLCSLAKQHKLGKIRRQNYAKRQKEKKQD